MPNGSSDVNRRSVRVDLQDVFGNTITDHVEITFFNQRLQSLNQRFTVEFRGAPALLPDVPAFPTGLAEVFIKPTKYRFKSVIADIPAGDGPVDLFNSTDRADLTFFVDPQKVKPSFPDISQLQARWPDLWAVLHNPNASSAGQWWTDAWWDDPANDRLKAGLLNLYAKMKHTKFTDGTTVFGYVREVWEVHPARIFVIADSKLRELVKGSTQLFHTVPGTLHTFRPGWHLVDSYKTFDPAGNLQTTFAEDDAGEFRGQGKIMSDTDIDDHQGIQHAFDVIKHTVSSSDSDPYDIHQILAFFQGIDSGYRFA
jgi:hypothetical protein